MVLLDYLMQCLDYYATSDYVRIKALELIYWGLRYPLSFIDYNKGYSFFGLAYSFILFSNNFWGER